MDSDAFQTRHLVDFPQTVAMSQPWHIPPSLPHSPPQVILVLGEPSQADLFPLLTSPHLTRSLLLVATHFPPRLPVLPASGSGPSVRILRLPSNLAAHENGALRVVNLLERTQRVARLWRYTSMYPSTSALVQIQNRVMQLAEEYPGGDFTLVEPVAYVSPAERDAVNGSDRSIVPQAPQRGSSPVPSFTSRTSSIGKSAQSKLFKEALTDMLTGKLPVPSSSSSPSSSTDIETLSETRTFDAILNFLPSGLPEKTLLKHAILVSTLCAQYLEPPVNSGNNITLSPPPPTAFTSRARSITQNSMSSLRPTSSSALDQTVNHGGTTPYARSYTSSTPQSSSLLPPSSGVNSTQGDPRRFSTMSIASGVSAASASSLPPHATAAPRTTGDRRSSFGGLKRRLSAMFGSSKPEVTSSKEVNGPRDSVVSLPTNYQSQNGNDKPKRATLTKRKQSTLRRGSSRNININTRSRTMNAHLVHVLPPTATVKLAPNQIRNGPGNSFLPVGGTGSASQHHIPPIRNYSLPTAYSPFAPTPTREGFDELLPQSSNLRQPSSLTPMAHTRTMSGTSSMSGLSAFSGLSTTSGFPVSTAGKPKFVQNLEQFLTNFSGGPGMSLSMLSGTVGDSHSTNQSNSDNNRPIPYIVSATLFGRRIPGTKGSFLSISTSSPTDNHQARELTVGEIILLGALDIDLGSASGEMATGRSWIGSLEDLVVVGSTSKSLPRPPLHSNIIEPALPEHLLVQNFERVMRTPSPLIKIWEEGNQEITEEPERPDTEDQDITIVEGEKLKGAEDEQKEREDHRVRGLALRQALERAKREEEEQEQQEMILREYTGKLNQVADKPASQALPTPPESSSSGEEADFDRGRTSRKNPTSRTPTRSKSRTKVPSSRSKSAVTYSPPPSSSSSTIALPSPMNTNPTTVSPIGHVEAQSSISIQAEYKANNHRDRASTIASASENSRNNGKHPHYVKRSSSAVAAGARHNSSTKKASFRVTTPITKPPVQESSIPTNEPNHRYQDANTLWSAPPPPRVKPLDQAAADANLSPQSLYIVPEDVESSEYTSELHLYPSNNTTPMGLSIPQTITRLPSTSSSSPRTLTKSRSGMRSVDSSGIVSVSGSIRASSPLARTAPVSASAQTMSPSISSRLSSTSGQATRFSGSGYDSGYASESTSRGIPRSRANSMTPSLAANAMPVPSEASTAGSMLSNDGYILQEPVDTQIFRAVEPADTQEYPSSQTNYSAVHNTEFRKEGGRNLSKHKGQEERRKSGFTGTLRKLGLWKKGKTSESTTRL